MNQETWYSVIPHYDHFNASVEQYQNISHVNFFTAQPRLKQAINKFVAGKGLTKVLLVNSPDNPVYRQLLQQHLSDLDSAAPVIYTESLDPKHVFGTYEAHSGEVTVQLPGLLEKANGGYLVLSANFLLSNPMNWLLLKAAVFGEPVQQINSAPTHLSNNVTDKHYNVKLVIVGDRGQLGEIDYLDSDIYSGMCMFSEVEPEIELTEQSISTYLGYLKWLCATYDLPELTQSGIERLMVAGARLTEDQSYMPLDVIWYRSLLEEVSIDLTAGDNVTKETLDKVIDARLYRESYLPDRALSDILDGQVIIETKGERVGQVNGLTVIDVPGHPLSYGEPARISCVIHFGDGDISDVERKAELGGNLHAKGMMIMQAFVSSAMNLDEPMPYSASVVFEQSYCEVDGDSASLAELCSFVSALSEYPINQQIAVTGAVDQFGRVQAVGGLNEKIEGFYHVCKHQGLTGSQGVILPKSNLKHLALHKDVVKSIQDGEFHIWSVSTVDEAVPIIMGKPFRGDDEESVIHKIAERIENFERHEHPTGLMDRIKNWFV
ncbi:MULTISPECIES: AAA family ATPase [unclassified Vibrio]|uniref:AAA family ATPase n=1 Tax=unclassified Vibrio TaxID=2614977 RepID=UPI00136164BD|nr:MULTISPECIES: Lon protease family protein [unclassified Vibrio]NAW57794.1 AAA family ATPase [Vibrio sp. V36_P2S2PM302]NAX24634.1 AAA family ATPase [Vibrio sp. V38_P2S17PM301]NAX29592.1 AAA family ATPase [Vibrio sp. V37_P2S8PM304]